MYQLHLQIMSPTIQSFSFMNNCLITFQIKIQMSEILIPCCYIQMQQVYAIGIIFHFFYLGHYTPHLSVQVCEEKGPLYPLLHSSQFQPVSPGPHLSHYLDLCLKMFTYVYTSLECCSSKYTQSNTQKELGYTKKIFVIIKLYFFLIPLS